MAAIKGPTDRAGLGRGVARPGTPLPHRYGAADLDVFDLEERRRFGQGDPGRDATLQWELLYRLEPELYDRLIRAEPLHPGILDWLPARLGTVIEVGAGSGRLTMALATRAAQLIAVEPAGPLRSILAARLAAAGFSHATAVRGFFDRLPGPDGWADLVVACSALAPDDAHGGVAGLQEMERCCRAGGLVAIVMPNDSQWLVARGYSEISFPGELMMRFASPEEAVEVCRIFYPHAVGEIVRRGWSWVPYDLLGTRPPCDLAFKWKAMDA
jgi:SAM-dependent methyltransferase